MEIQRTLLIVKPDAVSNHLTGEIIKRVEAAGFVLVGIKMIWLDQRLAEAFYQVHRDQFFFRDLVNFMTSGPCLPVALEAPAAISRLRELVGATDPAEAVVGTIRHDLGTNKQCNAVHASDSPQSAAVEVPFFFNAVEQFNRIKSE